ncbi:hypothetical protein VII00023_20762 [Vibrio ichthyoenteri ATCC 700023]|uniref:Uncharacterized protein n=1 Tax=Vibrio ichthyoenteri ATCC 700023 TaxID=870968 RepID=F9S7W5_9VIBR|nr:hypothetical protein [Vibrio ichthyoenteri]EGU31015.1 hypothetical protein VII00023_20762 [Vibrio ichthyoenteri ATCC 700023]
MDYEIKNDGKKLTFRPKCSPHSYITSFTKPSANTVSVALGFNFRGRGISHVIVAETTISQVSFHYDELTNSYFIQFGTGTTVSSFNFHHVELIADFLGYGSLIVLDVEHSECDQ